MHTGSDRVAEADLAPLELPARRSLQLIRVRDARFYLSRPYDGRQHVKTHFTYADVAYDIVVTDPLIEDRIWREQPVRPDCLMTVSLGGPYGGFHYKLVAAVIEL